MDEFDRANIHTARRLRDKQKFRIQFKFAADDQLLLVAARKRFGRQSCDRRTNIKILDDLVNTSINGGSIHKTAGFSDRRTIMNAKDRVFGKVRRKQKATPMPVLRNVRDA